MTENGATDDERALAIFYRGYARLLLEDYVGVLDDAHDAKRLDPGSNEVDVLLIAANLHLGDYQVVLSTLDDTVGEAGLPISPADVAPTLAVPGLPDAAETYLMRSIVRFLLPHLPTDPQSGTLCRLR